MYQFFFLKSLYTTTSNTVVNDADLRPYRVVSLKLLTDVSPHVVFMIDSVEANMVVIDLQQPVFC